MHESRSTILTATLLVGLAGCGGDTDDSGGGTSGQTTTSQSTNGPTATADDNGDGSGTASGSATATATTGQGTTTSSASDACEGPGPTPDWIPNVRVDDDQGAVLQTEVALAAGTDGVLVAGWIDNRHGGVCGYAVSDDHGDNWSENFFIEPQQGSITGDTVVGSDEAGNLYIACQDYGTSEIRLSRSTNGGQNWEPIRSVMDSPDKPWVAGARDGTVYLTRLGDGANYQRSIDGGHQWEPGLELGWVGHGTALAPGNEGTLHIAYNTTGDEMGYARSSDWGETLDGIATLGHMGQACYGCEPRDHPITAAAADPTGTVVALVWSSQMADGDLEDDVWALVSQNRGHSWSERLRVNDNPIDQHTRQFQPWVAVDGCGEIYVIWTDFRRGGTEAAIFYASTDDPDAGFGENTEITDDTGSISGFYGDYKAIVVQGEYVYAAWSDFRYGDGDIFFTRSKHARVGPLPRRGAEVRRWSPWTDPPRDTHLIDPGWQRVQRSTRPLAPHQGTDEPRSRP
jgi:hypothetical protein